MQTRIYAVRAANGEGKPRLVEATSQSQAIRHVTGDLFSAEVVRAKDLAHLMSTGTKVEQLREVQDGTTHT